MFGSLKKKLNAVVKRFSKKAEEELEPVAKEDTEKMSYEKRAEEKAGKEIVKPKTEAQKPLAKKKIKLFGRITEKELKKSDIENVAKSLKLTLIESDVAYDVAENICDKLESDLVGKVVKRGSVEKIIKRSLKDSLLGILNQKPIEIEKIIESAKKEKRPATIIFVGFNGCGKTTSLAKLAYYLKRRGFKPLIAAADTFRAASIEQLETHGKKLGVDVIKQKYGSVREAARKLKINRKPFLQKSKTGIRIKYIKASCDWDNVKAGISIIKTEKGNIVPLKNKKLTEDLMYLLGLIASDGCVVFEKECVRPNRIKFHNSRKELIEKFIELHEKTFPFIPIHIKRFRENLLEIDTHNTVLASIAYSLGIKSPGGESDIKHILKLPKKLIKAFLRGYFDGDGSAYFYRKNKITHTNIDFFTINRLTAIRLYQLLKRLGIRSKIYKKKIRRSFKTKNKFLFVVRLASPYDKIKFIDEVGCVHPKKMEVMTKIKSSLKKHTKKSDLDYVPLHAKKIIKTILRNYKLKIHHLSLGGNFWRVLRSDLPLTKYLLRRTIDKLSNFVKKKDLRELNSLLNSNFYLERIRSVREVKSKEEFVYDITVQNTHNFIPNGGIVISNCHDIGEKLGTGAHMKELRRVRTGPFSEREHHCYPPQV